MYVVQVPNIDAVTTAEAATILGVHLRTIHRWVDTGRLTPLVKAPGLRGAFIFDRASVERLAAEARVAS